MKKTQDTTIIAITVVIWTFAVTISRALRMPNDFSEAHWLLDYRFGFMKRGFVGSLCSLTTNALGLQMTPTLIAILSAIIFCIMSVAMLYILLSVFRQQQPRMGLLVLGVVFASSPFVVMSAHLFGYFDAFLYLLAIASVMLVLRGRPLLAAILSSLPILIHESYLLIGFPLVCLATIGVLTANAERRARWMPYVIGICIPVAVFLAVSLLQGLSTDAMTLRGQLAGRLDSFEFVASRSKSIALWQTTTFLEFFNQQIWSFPERILNSSVLASVGPTLLTILVFIHSSFRIRVFSPFSIVLLGLVCAPLAMHAVAWDTARISTYPIAGALIAWWILSETRRAQPVTDEFLLIALPALFLNVFGNIPLMDGKVERFTILFRLLLYFPAIAFVTTTAVENIRGDWFREFTEAESPSKSPTKE